MFRRFGVALFGVHAAIHLLGTIVYWRLGEPDGMEYRTSLLGGLRIGEAEALVFGGAWLLAAVLIAWAAFGLHVGRPWRAVAAAGVGLSLVLTVLVWPDAGWGAVLDVLVLPAVLIPSHAGEAEMGDARRPQSGPARPRGREGAEWSHGSLYGRL